MRKSIKIRSDLRDIVNTIRHFYELRDQMDEGWREIRSLWHHRQNGDKPLSMQVDALRGAEERKKGDSVSKLLELVEQVYRLVEEQADILRMNLDKINSSELTPSLRDYVEEFECYFKWVEKSQALIKQYEDGVKKHPKLDLNYSLVHDLIQKHQQLHKVLLGLRSDFEAIKSCKRYRIENPSRDPEREARKQRIDKYFRQSSDLMTVTFKKEMLCFSSYRQGKIIQKACEAYLNGDEWVGKRYLIQSVDKSTKPSDFKDAFQDKKEELKILFENSEDNKSVRFKLPT